ncbi:MAG TPA: urease accessory protein UreD [Rhodospirillales bacterium]|jgi:urease accessory protein|nr:urease accessory protein UreD [Rhodospirillales bacterium]HIL74019.1 urease accessory protein UreD [Rhodospirillales bacterium]
MNTAILQSNNKPLKQRKIIVAGKARLIFNADAEGVTRLRDLYQSDPQRILFPNIPDKDITQAVVVNTAGGLVGGDKISVEVTVEKKANALVTTQSAEKVYRSAGTDSKIEINLIVEAGSWLEYIPQETILFEGSRLRRQTHVNVERDGKLIAGEIVVFGRLGYGEHFQTGLIHDGWEIIRDGKLVWVDALHMQDDIASIIADPACFDGAVSMATTVYIGPDAEDNLPVVQKFLESLNSGVLSSVTCVNEILIIRWLSKDILDLRNDFCAFWGAFRNKIAGLPAKLPRLWNM